MTRYQTYKAIIAEINKLNKIIDWKIIKGAVYKAEAQKHKALVCTLKHLVSEKSWLNLFSFV